VTTLDAIVEQARWVVTALIRVPPEAEVGRYEFLTQIRAGTAVFDDEATFEVE
jgi:hypothetical protein